MKDDLINRKSVLDYMEGWKISIVPKEETVEYVQNLPSISAIPIDILCEWLTETKMPLANACHLIEEHHVCIQCDFFQRPIKECWKEILSKLMEEQNEAD